MLNLLFHFTTGHEQLAQLLGPLPKRKEPHHAPLHPATITQQGAQQQQSSNLPASYAPAFPSQPSPSGTNLAAHVASGAAPAAPATWHAFYRRLRATLRARVPDVQVLVKLYAALEGHLVPKQQQGGSADSSGGNKGSGGKQPAAAAAAEVDVVLGELDTVLDAVAGPLDKTGAHLC